MRSRSYLLELRLRLTLLALNAVLWIAAAAALWAYWGKSWNGVSGCLFVPAVYLGGALAAEGSYLAIRRAEARRNAVWAASARSSAAVTAFSAVLDILFAVVFPYAAYASVLLAHGTLRGLNGRLVVLVGVFTLLYLTLTYVIGMLTAAIAPGRIIPPALAFTLGLFLGSYLVSSSVEINSWYAFPLDAFLLLLIVGVLAVGVLIGVQHTYDSSARKAQTTSIAGIAMIVVLAWFFGPIDIARTERADGENHICEQQGIDMVCVWKEDAYKLPSLKEQARRWRQIITGTQYDAPPTLFFEPALPLGSLNTRYGYEDSIVLQATGGKNPNWQAGYGMIENAAYWECPQQDERGASTGYMNLSGIIGNYIYGDIDYRGYTVDSPDEDERRFALTERLAELPEDAQLAWLRQKIGTYAETCEFEVGM
ncbi:hypothetical protein [Actinobaculum sp. 352]|uniref:hypothetical protein n=1 Tax=Actinobaculum sp. 352 TaxID=2490946 RepID=UPI000F7D6DAB|nr:hypothetical protein [Actinobaculum sp. 352]RTE49331.1 hypothetical protein EKN07_07125 [Actinobaculum sp. 352]